MKSYPRWCRRYDRWTNFASIKDRSIKRVIFSIVQDRQVPKNLQFIRSSLYTKNEKKIRIVFSLCFRFEVLVLERRRERRINVEKLLDRKRTEYLYLQRNEDRVDGEVRYRGNVSRNLSSTFRVERYDR